MKCATINFSGNNGKSTIAHHMLVPRIKDALYLAVESINAGSEAEEQVRGKDYGALIEEVMLSDNAVIDIGASNVEDLMKLMRQHRGSHEEFDFFIVPAVKDSKQIADTMSTVRVLYSMGVPAKKIKVVMNKVDVDDNVEDIFYPLFAMHEKEKNFCLSKDAVIITSEIYPLLSENKTTIDELLNDKTDWREKMKAAQTPEEKRLAVRMISMIRLAKSAKENLDAVYKTIVGK